MFLPPYSPNLNLIERFWKYLRQKIINTTFYRTKGAVSKQPCSTSSTDSPSLGKTSRPG
ncbi:MAG: transposase [Hymenobacter sp.]